MVVRLQVTALVLAPLPIGSVTLNKSLHLKETASSFEKGVITFICSKRASPAAGKVCNTLRETVQIHSILPQRIILFTLWWHQAQQFTSLHSFCPAPDLKIFTLTTANDFCFAISMHHQPEQSFQIASVVKSLPVS